jgi:hypothetical protein
MTDTTGLSDRDLLITLLTKIDALIISQNDHETRLRALEQGAGSDHDGRIRALELASSNSKGFFSGIEWVKTFFVGVPVAVVAWYLGAR